MSQKALKELLSKKITGAVIASLAITATVFYFTIPENDTLATTPSACSPPCTLKAPSDMKVPTKEAVAKEPQHEPKIEAALLTLDPFITDEALKRDHIRETLDLALNSISENLRDYETTIDYNPYGPPAESSNAQIAALVALAKADPLVVDEIWATFLTLPVEDPTRAAFAEALSIVGSQDIQDRALEMSTDNALPAEERIAALGLLTRVADADRPGLSRATTNKLLSQMRHEQDHRVLEFQLLATSRHLNTAQELAYAQESLKPHLTHSEGSIRTQAVAAFGQFADTAQDLYPILDLAHQDPEFNVRSQAAYRLSQQKTNDPKIKQALIKVLTNELEHPDIRRYAVSGLREQELNAQELQLLNENLNQINSNADTLSDNYDDDQFNNAINET